MAAEVKPNGPDQHIASDNMEGRIFEDIDRVELETPYDSINCQKLKDGIFLDVFECETSSDSEYGPLYSEDGSSPKDFEDSGHNTELSSNEINHDALSNGFDSSIEMEHETSKGVQSRIPSFNEMKDAYSFKDVQNDDQPNDLSTLADVIKTNTEVLVKVAAEAGMQPSLDVNGSPLQISPGDKYALQAKTELLYAMKKLQSLVKGPLGILMDIGAHEILCLQAISRFNIAQAMGEDEELPFEELSRRCGLNIKDLQRILRYAMTNFIFSEPRPGIVRHTSVSQKLAQDGCFKDFIANVCEVRFPASASAVDALELYGLSQKPCQSGFSLSRGTDRGLYDELAHFPAEARRWNGAMSALVQQLDLDWIFASFLRSTTHVQYPLIVDVGGGRGDVSLALAERWPEPAFVVQDASNTAIMQGEKDTAHLRNRIRFQAYDFRTEQPLHNADVYYFKNIFHNWPDASCIEILRNQIRALKPGATILIDDFTLHEPGSLPWSEERRRRWMDINMLVFFGSRERSFEDWRELLAVADPRFQFAGIDSAPNQHNSILRVQWKG